MHMLVMIIGFYKKMSMITVPESRLVSLFVLAFYFLLPLKLFRKHVECHMITEEEKFMITTPQFLQCKNQPKVEKNKML